MSGIYLLQPNPRLDYSLWLLESPREPSVPLLDTNTWLTYFKSALEPGIAKAFGQPWQLLINIRRGIITVQRPGASLSVSLPRGFEAVSPMWIAQRIIEQLKMQAHEQGLISGNTVIASLAGRKQSAATP